MCPASAAQTTASPFLHPVSAAYDAAGNLFVADSARQQVFELTSGGALSVVAGNGTQGFSGDGGPAPSAELNAPSAVAVAPDGTLYIADTGNQRVRVVRAGIISTFAGNGVRGFAGDGGAATAASLARPIALALDANGALLICDLLNQRIRRVSSGVITTVAGNGMQGFAGDGAAALAAELNNPTAIVASADGRLFIADTGNQRIRVVSATGILSTFAGVGSTGASGDGSLATAAQFDRPSGLALDTAGNLLVADSDNQRLRRIAAGSSTITTLAGSGLQGAGTDGSLATASAQNLPAATALSPYSWPLILNAGSGVLQLLYTDGKLYTPVGMTARTSTVTASAPAATYGAAQASVSIAAAPGVAQGIVAVAENAAPVANATLTQGAATLTLPLLNAGTHTLTLSYLGDGLHPAAATSIALAIQPAALLAAAAPATMSYGATQPTMTGTLSGVLPQDAGNVSAVFTASVPALAPVGSYPITATLAGSASSNYTLAMAPGSGALTVVPAATVARLGSPQAAYATLPLELTATIASTTTGTPTGTVQFVDGGGVVATAALVNGSASAVDLNPVSGNHALSLIYSGDANFLPSNSAPVTEAVNALPDFTLSAQGSNQQTVLAGGTANFGFSVASANGPFTGAVVLSASGLPPNASVSFSPPAVVPGGSNAVVTMSIATLATTAHRDRSLPSAIALALCVVWIRSRRRRALATPLAALALCAIFGFTGCGARTATESVLPLQTFAIQVKATGTNLAGSVVQRTLSLTLSVQ